SLFEQFVNSLTESEEDSSFLKRALAAVAFHLSLCKNQYRFFSRSEFDAWTSKSPEMLNSHATLSKLSNAGFIRSVAPDESPKELYEFVHEGYCEWFAARFLADSADNEASNLWPWLPTTKGWQNRNETYYCEVCDAVLPPFAQLISLISRYDID